MDMSIGQPAEVDTERQEQAREYAKIGLRLTFVSTALPIVGIALILLTGFDVWLREVLHSLNWQPIPGWYALQVASYLVVLLLGYSIISAPLTFYRGFVLPHRYGLSTMTLRAWLLDDLKGLAFGLVFGVAVIELIYLLIIVQPQLWWLWVALALLFISVIMANLAPIVILPLFYKFSPLPDGELKQRLLALTNRANTRVRDVFTIHLSSKTTTANAALMGLGNTRRIVLGDTMVDRYTSDEIEVVLAHELGHHVHHDIWKLIISQSLFTLTGLYLFNVLLHWIIETFTRYQGLADPATLPLLLALSGIFGLIIMPLANGYSRAIEYQADEYALQVTSMVEPFKSAMTRLANQNLAEIEPASIVEFLFYDHPSIGKRLKHAEQFATR